MAWAQTEVDGLRAAPIDVLTVGASWRWTGQAVRVDGPQDLLLLDDAQGTAELHARAARMVRRLVGLAVGLGDAEPSGGEDRDAAENGFTVTDGRKAYRLTLIGVPDTGARLVMALGDLPPADCDLWVVSCRMVPPSAAPALPGPGGVICFAKGTLLRAARGPQPIEDLQPGDLLQTVDNGLQPILWTGSRRMTGARLHVMPHLRPVRFRGGALGIGRPDRDLLVSPRHRMLLRGAAAKALFNTPEVLVAAEDLVNDATVLRDHSLREVTYLHVLLEQHQVVWANGLETESFHPSNAALDTVDAGDRARLLDLLPTLADDPYSYGAYVRRNLTAPEAAILRHDRAA